MAANSVVCVRIWPTFELTQVLMYAIITSEHEKDPMETAEIKFPFKSKVLLVIQCHLEYIIYTRRQKLSTTYFPENKSMMLSRHEFILVTFFEKR